MTLVEMLNPFMGKKAGEAPDQSHDVQRVHDDWLERVLEARQRYRSLWPHGGVSNVFRNWAMKAEPPLLTPSQLNSLTTYASEHKFDVSDGIFVSYIMQKTLEQCGELALASPIDLPYLGTLLAGTRKRPFMITINGDLGRDDFEEANYCQVRVHGDGGESLGCLARHCRFEVDGNVTKACHCSVRTTYIIHGSANIDLGCEAKHNRIFVAGDIEQFSYSLDHSTVVIGGRIMRIDPSGVYHLNRNGNRFLTPNRATYDQLLAAGMDKKQVTLLDRMPTPEEVFK